MTLQKTRPVDTIQRMMSSIKHFERKLDKLQDDMNCQGQTLSDLRLMVLNLYGGTIVTPDTKIDFIKKRPQKISKLPKSPVLNEDKGSNNQDDIKIKQTSSIQPLAVKLKTKKLSQTLKSKRLESPLQVQCKMEANQIHMQRHRDPEICRKTNIIRTQKKVGKKLSKLSN